MTGIVGRKRVQLLLGLAVCALGAAAPLRAQAAGGSADEGRAGTSPGVTLRADTVRGRVVDAGTGMPVAGAQVRVLEFGRTDVTDVDGGFRLGRLPAGEVTLLVQRIGYAPVERRIRITAGTTSEVVLELVPSALQLPSIVVTGAARERGASETYRPTAIVEGSELRRRLGTSLAATISAEPGISERYNGPAAAQPVIRGLGGDRVLVLEDGTRTGDISGSGGDHAVAVEPLTAERVEVVRGPAGLLYGSNALGGVVNVIREDVPRAVPERTTGSVTVQGESVNGGVAGGGMVQAPLGDFAARLELSGRSAGDTRTPLGNLPSTDLEGWNGALGVSSATERGYIGVAVRDYALRYGVPGVFDGQVIPGAHEGGIGIELRRTAVRMDAGRHPARGPFRLLEASGSYTRYDQDELEREDGREIVGTEFGQLTATGRLVAHHLHPVGGIRLEGAMGVSTHWRDFSAAGNNTGTRPARQLTVAGFAYEELGLGALRLQLGARYDWSRITPRDTTSSSLLGDVRTRDFGALSGSFAALYQLNRRALLGASLARSFRTPAIEELYSNGPHLASHSYEIGNPDLGPEYGLGADLSLRITAPALTAQATVFENRITDFIHYAPTGQLDPRFQRYPVYRAERTDARLRGVETEVEWELRRGLLLGGDIAWVHAERTTDGSPLPAMPPFEGSAHVRVDRTRWFGGLEWTGAAAQRRTGEFEEPTPGYGILGAHAGVRLSRGRRLHTLSLTASNLTDQTWRDHLSRIRSVAPQPGRNLRLLYRFDF